MAKLILTPKHYYWQEFCDKLSSLLNAHSDDVSTGNCKGDFRYSERILRTFSNIDVEGTIADFKIRYGDCDCQVLTLIN